MLFTADDDASKNERHARSIAVGAAFEQQMDADPEFKAGVEKAQLMFGAMAHALVIIAPEVHAMNSARAAVIATPEGQSLLAELRQCVLDQDDELEAYGLDRVGNDGEKIGELCEVLQLDPHDIKNLGDLFKQARTQHKREVFLETARLAARREPNGGEPTTTFENNTAALAAASSVAKPVVKRRTPQRSVPFAELPLTAKQMEASQVVAECKGNIAEAARRIGVSRKTVDQHYKAAMTKLGKKMPKHRTKQAATDRRGQSTLATDADQR